MPESYNLLAPTPKDKPTAPQDAIAVQPAPVATQPSSVNLLNSSISEEKKLANAGFDLPVAQDNSKASSMQMANTSEQIIENIVKQATNTDTTEKQILQDLEQMDTSLELNLPASSQNPAKKKVAKLFFVVASLLAVVSVLYYLNSTQNLLGFTRIDFVTESQKKLTSVQADKVINNYLLSSIGIDQLALKASKLNYSFKYEDDFAFKKNKQDTVKILKDITANLSQADQELTAAPQVSAALLLKLNDEVSKYDQLASKEVSPVKKASYQSLNKIYTGAAKLSQNKNILPLLKGKSFDSMTNNDLVAFVESILRESTYSTNVQVSLVELTRTNWTEIFDELQSVTNEYDPAFNVFQNTDNYIVSFNNYTFNSDSGQISVNGEVKTRDSKTFTLISNLVDSLEASPLFKNLNYTTFAKSYDTEGEIYSSSLNLSFQLERNTTLNTDS